MRINRYLASCGVASRRACDKLIEDGAVKINGKTAELGSIVQSGDTVTVNGRQIDSKERFEYYILNKPKGYVTTVSDDCGRKTVMDLLPKTSARIYPVGRLDYDTEGLLILTNDGDLTYRLTHPKSEVPKTYSVKIEGQVSDGDLSKLRGGSTIDGVKTGKSTVRVNEIGKEFTKLTVIISEGRNRQVRKMFEAVGKTVVFLKRTKIGDLTLSGLDRGSARKLSAREVEYLKNI